MLFCLFFIDIDYWLRGFISIRFITCALLYSITLFIFHCTYQDLHSRSAIGLDNENRLGIYKLNVYEPFFWPSAHFLAFTATASLMWHHCLGHLCFDKLQRTLPRITLKKFVYESCQLMLSRKKNLWEDLYIDPLRRHCWWRSRLCFRRCRAPSFSHKLISTRSFSNLPQDQYQKLPSPCCLIWEQLHQSAAAAPPIVFAEPEKT